METTVLKLRRVRFIWYMVDIWYVGNEVVSTGIWKKYASKSELMIYDPSYRRQFFRQYILITSEQGIWSFNAGFSFPLPFPFFVISCSHSTRHYFLIYLLQLQHLWQDVEAANGDVLWKKCSWNLLGKHQRSSLLCKPTFLKSQFGMGLSCKIAAYFQSTFS